MWGLPERFNESGARIKLWIPAGLVIPYIKPKTVKRIRIRCKEGKTRYCTISGSSSGAMIFGTNEQFYIVVESELDAMLINQEAEDIITTIALGSAQARPDSIAHELLKKAIRILVALDTSTDEKKEKAGYREFFWWKNHFEQVVRWPTVFGKDPADAQKNGLSIRNWIIAGL